MKASSRCCLLASLLAVSTVTVHAETAGYPNKPVQIIADLSAGSTPDVALRFVAEALTRTWGQQVLVVNRPGAGGSVGARAAAEAAPDGYTLYQPVLSTFVALHPAAPNVPLHVPKDFLPIGFVAENPMFIAVAPSLGVKSLKELIALPKSVLAKFPMPRPESVGSRISPGNFCNMRPRSSFNSFPIRAVPLTRSATLQPGVSG